MSQNSIAISRPTPWLLSPRWDLLFLIGSVILVPLPLLIKNGLGLSVSFVNLIVTILIGGPHLFGTFTYTLMEKRFWKKYPYYAMSALLIPPIVIFLGLNAFDLLIAIFFSWASIHILHQVCYIADCYQAKSGIQQPRWLKFIEYGVVMTSIYPIASYKLVQGNFVVANQSIKIPFVYGNPFVFIVVSSLFVVSLCLFIFKLLWDLKKGTFHLPKTLLITATVIVSFLLPIPKDLDVTFQGFNTWHSLQYLALAWWINVLRKERHEISSPFVEKIAGKKRTAYFYLTCLVPTLTFLVLITFLAKTTSLPFTQCYFMVTLSGLLVHYYFDHWLFTQTRAVVPS